MKLKLAVSSWTILIPSLLLNIALLVSAAYFLDELESNYQQASSPAGLARIVNGRPHNAGPRLASHVAAPGNDWVNPGQR